MNESFSSYEDELNTLFNKFSKIFSTFKTLSREQAEKAILDTNSLIKTGESLLEKMEQSVNSENENSNNNNQVDINVVNNKITNYKREFNKIVEKFKSMQDNYINKKAANALIDEIEVNNNNKELIDDENTNNICNNNKKEVKSELKNNNEIIIKNDNNNGNNIININNISGEKNEGNDGIGQNFPDEHFHVKNSGGKNTKKIMICIGVFVFVVIISIVLSLCI